MTTSGVSDESRKVARTAFPSTTWTTRVWGDLMATTAWAEGYRVLFHWQRYDEGRLRHTLESNQIYCPSPSTFNDPWDCKPHFNTEILQDPTERCRHSDWAVDLCNRRTNMSAAELERMRQALQQEPARAAGMLNQISSELAPEINRRYRVYCMGPDVDNLLMWAHYSDSHRGICLEFDLQNDVLCAALKCEYSDRFPLTKLRDDSEAALLGVLLAKSSAWAYEHEFRLVAQERGEAVRGVDTLLTDNSLLQLPQGALRSVIVGCQSEQDKIRALVHEVAPAVRVRTAVRVPNRFELAIAD